MGRQSAKHSNDRLQGTIDLIVLRLLESRGPLHGYSITQQIANTSDNVLRLQEGSLYPALHRLEQKGWLKAEWGQSETGHEARFYSLTRAGRKQLAAEKTSWDRLNATVQLIFGEGE